MTGTCAYDLFESPVGPLLAAVSPLGLTWLSYVTPSRPEPLGELEHRLGQLPRRDPAALAAVRAQLDEYFTGERTAFDLPLDWSLAPGGFLAQALKVTATIPYGTTMSYGEVAMEAGSPGASRAVGNAMRSNAIAIVVPCHRVLAAGGRIGGYMGGETNGLSFKRHLLDLERCAYRP